MDSSLHNSYGPWGVQRLIVEDGELGRGGRGGLGVLAASARAEPT